jgi:hypothetical protein
LSPSFHEVVILQQLLDVEIGQRVLGLLRQERWLLVALIQHLLYEFVRQLLSL